MSGTFLDDALLQVTLNAYKAAGQVTKTTLAEGEPRRQRLHSNAPILNTPAAQALVDLRALADAAIPALRAFPPAGDGTTARRVIDALGNLPVPRPQSTPLTPRPEITTLTKSMALASEMVTSARTEPTSPPSTPPLLSPA